MLEPMELSNPQHEVVADYYKRHRDEILNFVASRTGSVDDAEDIVQDVFVRLLAMPAMISPVTLPSLVYTTARHLVLDRWRHRQRVEAYEHRLGGQGAGAPRQESAESVYSVGEIISLLEHGVARLSPRQQTIYRMSFYEGKGVRDISLQLGMNAKTVENRLGMARKEVRGFVKKRYLAG